MPEENNTVTPHRGRYPTKDRGIIDRLTGMGLQPATAETVFTKLTTEELQELLSAFNAGKGRMTRTVIELLAGMSEKQRQQLLEII